MSNKKEIILDESSCAPDPRRVFREKFKEKLGMTVSEFQGKAKCNNTVYSCHWSYNGMGLDYFSHRPWLVLHKLDKDIKIKVSTQEGLKHKYNLTKADGRPVDPEGIYFILKLNSKDKAHKEACQAAALEYAERIEEDIQVPEHQR